MCMCIPECTHLFRGDDESPSNLQMEAVLHFEDTSIMSPAGARGSPRYSQRTANSLARLPALLRACQNPGVGSNS